MAEADPRSILHVPARDIPLPAHLSPQARAQMLNWSMTNPAWPAQEDIAAWRALIARMDEMGLADEYWKRGEQ